MKARMTVKLIWSLVLIASLVPFSFAEDNVRVKVLMEEALKVYSDGHFVRALDLFKQIQRIDPSNAIAADYVKNCEQRILEWEKQEGDGAKGSTEPDANWDTLLRSKKSKGPGATLSNANDIIAARKSLVDRMRNRASNTDNIVQIQDTKKGMDITLFHDQLFLPGLQTLRDEALPILENVAQLIRDKGDREIMIRSLTHSNSTDPFLLYPEFNSDSTDTSLPQIKNNTTSLLFQDIEATRSFILFTYIAQRSMGTHANLPKE